MKPSNARRLPEPASDGREVRAKRANVLLRTVRPFPQILRTLVRDMFICVPAVPHRRLSMMFAPKAPRRAEISAGSTVQKRK